MDARGTHEAGEAPVRALEGPDLGRVGLGYLAGEVDLVVCDDKHAAARGPGMRRGRDCIIEVHGAVRAHGGGGPHGPDKHDRLLAADDEIQKIRGLLHGVGPVGHHDSGRLRPLEGGLDPSASARHTDSLMSWLPMLATCTASSLARDSTPGAARISDSIEKKPER